MVPIMFDEADHLIRSTPSLLEVVRDITDITGTMCFLVGMERFAFKVAQHGHIASRVARSSSSSRCRSPTSRPL
jgi:DNA transposition AAA+ family ATPase